jgi:hypothetical protein
MLKKQPELLEKMTKVMFLHYVKRRKRKQLVVMLLERLVKVIFK